MSDKEKPKRHDPDEWRCKAGADQSIEEISPACAADIADVKALKLAPEAEKKVCDIIRVCHQDYDDLREERTGEHTIENIPLPALMQAIQHHLLENSLQATVSIRGEDDDHVAEVVIEDKVEGCNYTHFAIAEDGTLGSEIKGRDFL